MRGFHGEMLADEYHAAQALSAGGAWLLANECPAIYWHGSPFNPAAVREPPKGIMDIGTALHLAALEPQAMTGRVVEIDAADYRTKAAQEARDAAHGAGLTPLLGKDTALVTRLHAALYANKGAAALLDGAVTETSYFWTADGVPCKARADLIAARPTRLGDLKASASAAPEFFARQAFNAGHFLRAAWYLEGARECIDPRCSGYWFIVVAREEPHLVTVCQLDERALEWGRQTMRRALALFRMCRERNEWPGYVNGPTTIGLPTWAEYRLADREDSLARADHAERYLGA